MASTKPIGGTTTINALPTLTCQAGYFTLYFAPGSIFTSSVAAQNLICQVATDISNLIISNTAPGSIPIYCTDTPTNQPNALGVASAFFVFPNSPNTPANTILDNQVYKALISGQNPYANIPLNFVNASGFYYGMVQMNPNPPAAWSFNLNTVNIGANQFDAYTVMEHEFLHALGFLSLIGNGGVSLLGPTYNYFSRYDKFLFDHNGNPLLSSTSPSTCGNSNLNFVANPTVVATTTNGCATDVTTCSLAVQYISPNVQVDVYTPNCYELGSSLSHFEDMCTITSTVDLGCATNTNVTLNNNLYYVMCNGGNTGPCYVKRHPKEEDKWVLCDLGYSVSSVYTSTVAGSSYTYPGGGCNGPNIWGMNDGLLNNNFIYTVALTFTNAISIPTILLAANDATTTSVLGCFSVVAGAITHSMNGSNLVVSTSVNFSGMAVLSYIPKTVSGKYGNITYVFVYFVAPNCPAYSVCDLVPNGSFENASPFGQLCGSIYSPPTSTLSAIPDCWLAYTPTPDYFKRGCSVPFSCFWDVGLCTIGSNPAIDSYTGPFTGNDAFSGVAGGVISGVFPWTESIMCQLTSPLQPSQVYQLSLLANNVFINGGFAWQAPAPVVLNISSMPLFISGATKTVITSFTVNPGAQWTAFTNTFVFPSAISHSVLVIDLDISKSMSLGLNPADQLYCMFDEVSLLPLPTTTFIIPSANHCGNVTFINLAQYASPVPGVFTGTGVTSTVTANGTQYNFNISGTLSPGVYPVAFNYTTNSGCAKKLWQTIVIAPSQTLGVNASVPGCMNAANPATLTTSLSCTSCTNLIVYSWQPGALFGASQTVIPSPVTIYTASAFNGTCAATQTLALNFASSSLTLSATQNTVCSGSSLTLSQQGLLPQVIGYPEIILILML